MNWFLFILMVYLEFGLIMWLYLAARGDVAKGIRAFCIVVFCWAFMRWIG